MEFSYLYLLADKWKICFLNLKEKMLKVEPEREK